MQPELSPVQVLGEWRPDIEGPFNDFARTALNVIARGADYIAVEAVVEDMLDALAGACRGAVAVKDRSGTVSIFAGTSTALYILSGGSWDDVTRTSGGAYAVPNDGRWVFSLYGERLIAADYADATQFFDLGSSTEFGPLANAPKCREMAVVNNFVMMGNTFDGTDGARPNRVRWSGIDDTEAWAVSATTQSDFQDLENGFGAVKAVAGYQNYAVIMQEKGILQATYVGAPDVFDIQPLEGNQGPVGGNTVVIVGQRIFYLAEAGFFMFDGVSSVPIGHDKVDSWFFDNLKVNTLSRITASYNPKRKIVSWGFVSNASSSDYPDYVLIYNWVEQKFSLIQQGIEVALVGLSSSKTIEDIEAIYGDLEDVPFSLDDPIWAGGNTLPAVFTHNHKLAYWNGDAMDGTVETGETRLNSNGRAFVSAVSVITDATTTTVTGITRNLPNDDDTESAALDYESATGEHVCRLDARYHRAKIVLSDWSYVRGAQYRSRASGGR